MNTDLTFITNENEQNLKTRFQSLIKDTKLFDILVGYFYTSGFYEIYPELEKTEKIRILIGISTNKQTYDLIQKIQSQVEIENKLSEKIKDEMATSKNNFNVEVGVKKFLEWLKSKKLEIKVYPEEKIHSKLYIMTFNEDDRDLGRVITGSSNFTKSGLVDNLEFNVELKNASDYKFAQDKFNDLWENSFDISEQYIETLENDTWIRDDISPYELYLKFLYEYFKDEINSDDTLEHQDRPNNFKELKYQDHAVINAKKIIEEYNGVFLSDVVGLGKTYMATMLCQELGLKTLVLAPPHLIDEDNEGSWENAFKNFNFKAKDYKCKSIGMLDSILRKNLHQEYDVILIDEAHRFRTDTNETYAMLSQICYNKKVILVTATPYNNSPDDLLAQISLFQSRKNSTIPGLPDLNGFFKRLRSNISKLDRKKDEAEFLRVTKENARLIRKRVLKYLMVRRTRTEIIKYYEDDLKKQNMKFPEVADPSAIFYEFDELEDKVFFDTIETITKKFKYSRYTPLLYKKNVSETEKHQQTNMMKFMKILLVKRLESSFYAFNKSINRFIISYKQFINQFEKGKVYVSKSHMSKIFDYMDMNDDSAIHKLLETDKARVFSSNEFEDGFIEELKNDLRILEDIKKQWLRIKRDPKLIAFKKKLAKEESVHNGKSIIFTESKETAEYLEKELQDVFPKQILYFSGKSSKKQREVVMENFDANSKNIKNDYKLLITTDVLSEGTNLHQANVVINYDIPWNPTKIMQRVGRINRVDTKFDIIYTYTFFPTKQSNDQIKLKQSAKSKVSAFIKLLGVDSKLLTNDENIETHGIFDQILSKSAIVGEQSEVDSELLYLQEIRKIKAENEQLYEKIRRLPKKSRSAKQSSIDSSQLVTYFRKGKLEKFFIAANDETSVPEEIDFMKTAGLLKSKPEEIKKSLDKTFYDLLHKNLDMLKKDNLQEEEEYSSKRSGMEKSVKLYNILNMTSFRQYPGFNSDDKQYIKAIINALSADVVPKKITQKIDREIESNQEVKLNPMKLLAIFEKMFPKVYLNPRSNNFDTNDNEEIILSAYLKA